MTMFILPGLLCNLSMFSATMGIFPGATGIDDFYGRETTLAGMADHALAQAPDRFVLLGHSMGARLRWKSCAACRNGSKRWCWPIRIHPAQPGERESAMPCAISGGIRALPRWSIRCRRC
jgi:hypothetical protein